MSEMIIIKNEYLTVAIDSFGAEIKSIKDTNEAERIHQGDMFWKGSAPVLFPICGKLYDGNLRIHGKEYTLKQHGFARISEFEVMEATEDMAVFSLKANDETRKVYPYEFELLVTYKLLGKAIDVCYEVINDSKEKMYFSVGSHEAYNCMDGLDNYYLEFENTEKAIPSSDIEGDLGLDDGKIEKINLSEELFTGSRSIIFKAPTSDAVTLKNKDGSEEIRVEYEGHDLLVIWAIPNARFICIEPWCGAAELSEFSGDISQKPAIQCIEPGVQFEKHHIITFLK